MEKEIGNTVKTHAQKEISCAACMYDVEATHSRWGVQSCKQVQEEIRQVSEGSVDR